MKGLYYQYTKGPGKVKCFGNRLTGFVRHPTGVNMKVMCYQPTSMENGLNLDTMFSF